MALGGNYATVAELKGYLGQNTLDTTDDTQLTDALNSASREIDKFCRRQFNDAGAATARVFYPNTHYCVEVDDFSTVTGFVLATDEGDDGTYETTWSAGDYQLEPLNNVVDGETGWPYYKIRSTLNRCFPTIGMRAPVQVTARWGWTAVPANVKQACLILAAETFRLKGAPLGFANNEQFGPVPVRGTPMVAKKLAAYVRDPVMVA